MDEKAYNLTGDHCPEYPGWEALRKIYRFAPGVPASLRSALRETDLLLAAATPVKVGGSTSAGIARVGGESFFIKRSNVPSWRDRFRRLGRVSRAARNEKAARRIAALGIRVPEVLMTLETSSWGIPGPSYLVLEYFPAPMNAADNFAAMLRQAPVEHWAERMSGLMARLHQNGVAHGDLKMVNFLALPEPSAPDGFVLGVFDFDGSSVGSRPCSRRVRSRELARAVSSFYLNLLETDRSMAKEYPPGRLLQIWCGAYAAAGGPDLSCERYPAVRLEKFLRKSGRGEHGV